MTLPQTKLTQLEAKILQLTALALTAQTFLQLLEANLAM